ncbi:type I glutamate--ammonia ligase [bacterium]|nr:type I glutamate--ammonia ligase [bacterium]
MIKQRGIKHIDLKFTDFIGRWHHITLPSSRADEKLLSDGVGFDGSNFQGFKTIESGDLSLLPDLGAAFIDPFQVEPTISFICKIVEPDSKKPFGRDPRLISQKAEEYLATTGKANRSIWGPEFEFHIFDEIYVENSKTSCGYEIIPSEGLFKDNFGLEESGGYHALPPEDTLADIRNRIVTLLEEAGVGVTYHHHEVGGHGQVEIEVISGPITRMGDISMMVKYFSRMTAHESGKKATFMPKPIYGEPGNGMHFHQHLFKNEKPAFFSKDGYAGLSKLAHQYIAGLLIHAPALLAITNPSTNSYKRLVPGYEAPVHRFFSLANRSAAIRIPKYATSPEQKRIEFRPPDATCNVYLSMAAQLMAGIDGIQRSLNPKELGFGPFDIDVFQLKPDERNKIKLLPGSLSEALEALKEDHEFLLKGDVFSESMIEDWIQIKHEQDIVQIMNRPHPYEHQLYFDC